MLYKLTYYATLLCGFCALAFEVLWTRSLSVALGTTVYTFSIILASFLSGIALGSLLYTLTSARNRLEEYKQLGLVLLALSAVTLAVSQVIPSIPGIAIWLNQRVYGHSQGVRMLTSFGVSYTVVLLPSLLFGIAFPICAAARNRLLSDAGQSAGDTVGLNTIGAVAGSLVAGFVMIPFIGMQSGMHYCSIAMGLYGIGILYFWIRDLVSHRVLAPAFCLVCAIGLLAGTDRLESWDTHLLGAFRNNRGEIYTSRLGAVDVKKELTNSSVLFYKEGVMSNVSVIQESGERSLLVNGKSVASDNYHDMGTQQLLGHLPCFFHPNPKTGLVIGMGTGVTLSRVAMNPSIETVDLAEIEAGVVQAAANFPRANRSIHQSEKLNIEIRDGRDYLKTTQKKYDVITADPIHPWTAGSSHLFTKEYFALAARRLEENGVMAQWLPLYEFDITHIQSIIATFASAFDHVILFQWGFDSVLLGSQSPLKLDIPRLNAIYEQPVLRDDLSSLGLDDLNSFLALFVCGKQALQDFSSHAVINTDDNLYLEYATPFSIGSDSTPENASQIAGLKHASADLLAGVEEGGVEPLLQTWTQYQRIENEVIKKIWKASSLNDWKELHQQLPQYKRLNIFISQFLVELSKNNMQAGNFNQAVTYAENALQHYAEYQQAHYQLASLHSTQPPYAPFFQHVDLALQYNPNYAEAWVLKGKVYMNEERLDEAMECFQNALAIRPPFWTAHVNLARVYYKQGKMEPAIHHFNQALYENPYSIEALFALGQIELQTGSHRTARRLFERIIEIDPYNAKGYLALGTYWRVRGYPDKSEEYVKKAQALEQGVDTKPAVERLF